MSGELLWGRPGSEYITWAYILLARTQSCLSGKLTVREAEKCTLVICPEERENEFGAVASLTLPPKELTAFT